MFAGRFMCRLGNRPHFSLRKANMFNYNGTCIIEKGTCVHWEKKAYPCPLCITGICINGNCTCITAKDTFVKWERRLWALRKAALFTEKGIYFTNKGTYITEKGTSIQWETHLCSLIRIHCLLREAPLFTDNGRQYTEKGIYSVRM